MGGGLSALKGHVPSKVGAIITNKGDKMKTWTQRVEELEKEGLTRSDAQGCADVEVMQGKIEDDSFTG